METKLIMVFLYIVSMAQVWLVCTLFQLKQEIVKLNLGLQLNLDILTKLALEDKIKEELEKRGLDK